MTPEEFDRKMEFIVEHQARFSIHLEDLAAQLKQFGVVVGQLAADRETMVKLLDIQSRRLDRAEKEDREAQKRHEALLAEIRTGFNQIVQKLQ